MYAQWKTRDLIITAALAVALGVLMAAWTVVYNGGEVLLTKVGANLLYGIYFLPGILIPYIVRKPGAALLGSLVAAAVELMFTQWGLPAIIYGALQGLGAEVVFAAFGWKDYRFRTLSVAAIVSMALGFVFEYWQYGYAQLAQAVQVAYLLLRIPSAIVLAAWLGKELADALARTGVLRGMALTAKAGAQTPPGPPPGELEVALARMKSYAGPAVLVLAMYSVVVLWLPGVVANYLFYQEAKQMEQTAGRGLPGVGLLSLMLWLNFLVLALILMAVGAFWPGLQ